MTGKLPRVDGQQLIRALKHAGFVEQRQRGSHLHMRSADGRRVTIPVHTGRDVPVGTLKGILRDADISLERFQELL